MLVIGVDPGKTGAAALLENGRQVVDVYDWHSAETAFQVLADWHQVRGCRVAYVEIRYGAPIPGNGWQSIIGLARNIGAWDAMLAVAGLRVVPVHPKAWQSRYLLPGPTGRTKERSIESVRQLVPDARRFVFNAGHHGRSDAILIAMYGYQRESGIQQK